MTDNFLQKGREALSSGDWENARKILEAGLDVNPSAGLYEELARACWWLNDFPAVFDYRTKAFNLYLQQTDPFGASRNAAWLGIDYLELKGEFPVANGWFQRAEDLLRDQPPSAELGLIKLLKARISAMSESTNENAFKLLDESLALSREFGKPEGVIMAKALKGSLLVNEGRIREGMALLDEATLTATTIEPADVNFITIACCMLIDACERVRDYERAGQWCHKVQAICRRWKFEAMFASCRNLYATVLIWHGEWQHAEKELLQAEKELKILRPNYVNASVIRLADLRRRQGKWDETAALLESAGPHTLKLLYCAALAYEQDNLVTAANFGERHLRQLPPKEKTIRFGGLELLFRIYLKQERLEEAEQLLSELREIAGIAHTPSLESAVKSAEGLWLMATGSFEKAKSRLEDAIDLFDKTGIPFESARNRLELAGLLVQLEEFRLAEAELRIALRTFQDLGAEKDVERTNQLLRNMHRLNAEAKSSKSVYEFTGRELEVLRLLAEGKNNEEIAEQLFLSVRTIEKHITNLYLKMGVSGKSARAFAASYAIRHKLVFN